METSSDRPRTPPRSVWELSQNSITEPHRVHKESIPRTRYYRPHLFDLIYPLKDALRSADKTVPPTFIQAEAVDSAVRLGEGASFAARLQKLPKGPESVTIKWRINDTEMNWEQKSSERPDYVVYKVARVAFNENGCPLPEHHTALQSVLNELHALTFPTLKRHANIIDFLGIAFGSNPFNSGHRLPVLVTEYAQYGTLANLLSERQGIDLNTGHALALDVGRGLSALHEVGLVHGDIKTENILVCAHPTRRYIAKLADFGFSVVDLGENTEMLIGGTRPWKAPETSMPLRINRLHLTDVYSYGLLVWTIAVGGISPFDLILNRQATYEEIEEIKQRGLLLRQGQLRSWFNQYLQVASPFKLSNSYKTALGVTSSAKDSVLSHNKQALLELTSTMVAMRSKQDKLIRSLNDTFEWTLQLDPDKRDLEMAVAILELDVEESDIHSVPQPQTATNSHVVNVKNVGSSDIRIPRFEFFNENASIKCRKTESKDATTSQDQNLPQTTLYQMWRDRGFRRIMLSWEKVRLLEPAIQNFVFNNISSFGGPNNFLKSALHMNGYGTRPNALQALEQMELAASRGHYLARAYLHRFWLGCKATPDVEIGLEESPGVRYLKDYALIGSRPALEEYSKMAPQSEVDHLKRLIRDADGGVGATWLNRSEMLNGYTQSHWIKDDWLMEQVRTFSGSPSELIVNKRGDTVLHFAAMCGRVGPFVALLKEFKMDVNLKNPLGETPLLCAMRAGQGGIVIKCLQTYKADASIAARNGETPLHWLISHDDQWIPFIVRDLLANKAGIDAMTLENVCHSEFSGELDIDTQVPGTPLQFAVHHNRPAIVQVLCENGADPDTGEGSNLTFTPLRRAAYYHHHKCLKLMLEHLETKVTKTFANGDIDKRYATTYGLLVEHCVVGADRFLMILRNGNEYLNRLHLTLDLLRKKSKMIDFEQRFSGSLLYYVVSEALDDVLQYMLRHDWCLHTINYQWGVAKRTPLLEIVRWNRGWLAKPLIEKGADVYALAANPFHSNVCNWSALHVFAQEGHENDLSLLELLLEYIPVDGSTIAPPTVTRSPAEEGDLQSGVAALTLQHTTAILPCETPLAVALRHNAFNLSSMLSSKGANPNALCLSAGLFSSTHPLTILGHMIISNARYSSARLNNLLNSPGTTVDFVVGPARRLTALHRSVFAHRDVQKVTGEDVNPAEFDFDTNADILYELLLKWKSIEELNAKCDINESTALHLAVEVGNLEAVRSLLEAGADPRMENIEGMTPLQLVQDCQRNPAVEEITRLLSSRNDDH